VAAFIRKNCDRLVAIGEVGLDYWLAKEEEEREVQRRIFSLFIDLAIELDLPLNVHSRSAGRHALDLLLEKKAEKVQMHAFDGKISAASPGVDAGFFFSVPPSIVRSRQKQKLVRHLPPTSLLLESDSPVLGPEADKRNEPANIAIAAAVVAELKNVTPEEIVKQTAQNSRRLYRLTD
jgi:TatD DNase family protein